MKRILSGMFFSLFRGFGIWCIIIAVVILGALFDFSNLRDIDIIAVGTFGETRDYSSEDRQLIITPENIDQYSFKGSGISAFDVYRFHVDPLPHDKFDQIADRFIDPYDEVNSIFDSIRNMHVIPSLIVVIFIAVFFGRMFSQGTIKNLLTCGYSRAKIFIASFIVTAVTSLVLFLLRLAGFVLMCMLLKWQPPVYLPVLIPTALISFLLMITINSFTLAALFITNKKTVTFIIGFLMFFSYNFSVSKILTSALWTYDMEYQSNSLNEDYINLAKEKRQNELEERLDYADFTSDFYHNDRIILDFGCKDAIPAPIKYTMLVLIYSDPALLYGVEGYFPPYLMTRDGLIYIPIAVNIIWIVVSSGLGVAVFRKREIHC